MKTAKYALLAAGLLTLGLTAARTPESAKAASAPKAAQPEETSPEAAQSEALQPAERPNTLTPEEEAEGWILLFDGVTTAGWHTFNRDEAAEGWTVRDGELRFRLPPGQKGRGDLVTDAEFEDFDLRLEWKISEGGNSGIFFGVKEGPEYGWASSTGVEMQVLDNQAGADRFDPTHLAGAMYDLIDASETSRPNPAGCWNRVRILKRAGKVTFRLNGIVTAQVDMNSPEWRRMVARSKWNGADRFNGADFGKFPCGRIALQDHFDEVAYRNIKIRPLGREAED